MTESMTDRDRATPPQGYELGRAVREDWPVWVLLGLALAAGSWLYPTLPDRVPLHWNLHGEVDGWGSRSFAVFGMLGIFASISALLVLLPLVDPRRESYARFLPTYRLIRLITALVCVGTWGVALAAARGVPLRVDVIVPATVSVLFVVLGNVMGRLRHNWFVGIRTPWSLANEEAWRLTHRTSGPVFVAGGLVGLVGSFVGGRGGYAVTLVGILGPAAFSIVYSYFAYKSSVSASGSRTPSPGGEV